MARYLTCRTRGNSMNAMRIERRKSNQINQRCFSKTQTSQQPCGGLLEHDTALQFSAMEVYREGSERILLPSISR